MKPTQNFILGVRINRVIQFLTYSDFLVISGWGLVNPILAVFFTEQIEGGSVAVAGLATTIFFIIKSIIQIPVARYIDAEKGEWDDFRFMVIGSFLTSICAFLFFFARYPWQVYTIQIINGLGSAFSYPSWMAIFTRHIDSRHEGFEWSLYYTTIDLGAALTAGLGGFLAASFGYKGLFMLVGIASLIGTAFLTGITADLKRKYKQSKTKGNA